MNSNIKTEWRFPTFEMRQELAKKGIGIDVDTFTSLGLMLPPIRKTVKAPSRMGKPLPPVTPSATHSRCRKINLNGVAYPSIRIASEKTGFTIERIRDNLKRSKSDTILIKDRVKAVKVAKGLPRTPMTVTVNGVTYESVLQASIKTKQPYAQLMKLSKLQNS